MNKGKRLKGQQGFTLLETVVVMTVGVILILTIFMIASWGRRVIYQDTARNYNLLATRQALSQITEELRYADSMKSPKYTSPVTSLASATFTVSGCRRVIDMEGNSVVIKRYNDANGTSLLSSQAVARSMVRALSFSRNATAAVDVALTVKEPSKAANPTLKMSVTVRMMNISN